jgi:hypothetical protein
VSKLVLDTAVPAGYEKSAFAQIIRAICGQVNTLSEGRLAARYQAQESVPVSVSAAVGDIVWDSNATVTSGSVRLGWICTVESPTNATFQEVRVLNSVPAAVTAAATQAEQETGTSTTVYVSPGRQHFHPSAAKAWVVFTVSGTTVTVQSSYNVTGVARNSIGNYTVTWDTDFASANYAFAIAHNADRAVHQTLTPATGTLTFTFDRTNDLALQDPPRCCVVAYGDHA